MRSLRLMVSFALVSLALVACQRSETPAADAPVPAPAPAPAVAPAPFRVSGIELGNAIGADKRVAAPSTSFAATDTIYASVATEGASPSVALAARWTYQDGQLVNEETQAIAPTGAAVSEFHISKPDGWPAGNYRVEVIANGASAGARDFQVR
jgi:hypothetical protein